MPLMGVLGLLARRHRHHPESPALVDLVRHRWRSAWSSLGGLHAPRPRLLPAARCSTANACWLATSWRWTWLWPCCSRRGSTTCSCRTPAPRARPRRPPAVAPSPAPAARVALAMSVLLPHPPRGGGRPAGGAARRRDVVPALPPRAGLRDPVVAVAPGGLSDRARVPSPWPPRWLVLRRGRLLGRMPRVLSVLVVVDLPRVQRLHPGRAEPQRRHLQQRPRPTRWRPSWPRERSGAGGRVTIAWRCSTPTLRRHRRGRARRARPQHPADLSSVQGYGPWSTASYDGATDTHNQLNMNISALRQRHLRPPRPRRARDGARVLHPSGGGPHHRPHHAVTPGHPHPARWGPRPVPPSTMGPRRRPRRPTTPRWGPPPPRCRSPPRARRTQYFGTVLSVTAVDVPVAAVSSRALALRVGLLAPDGAPRAWIGSAARTGPGGDVAVSSASPMPASGDRPRRPARPGHHGAPAGVGAGAGRGGAHRGQGTYRVDGSLRDVIAPGQWRYRRA